MYQGFEERNEGIPAFAESWLGLSQVSLERGDGRNAICGPHVPERELSESGPAWLRAIYDEVAFRRPCTKCYRRAVISVLSGFAILVTLSPDVGLRLGTLDRSLTQK